MPHNWVLGIWVKVLLIHILGKYMVIKYLDPWGKEDKKERLSQIKAYARKIESVRSALSVLHLRRHLRALPGRARWVWSPS